MGAAVVERLLALPTQTKILVANSLLIALSAIVGAILVGALVDQAQIVGLALVVATSIAVSVVINWVLVRIALQPMLRLTRTAAQVRPGQQAPRFTLPPWADADTRQLAEALNAMLDRQIASSLDLEASRRQLQALASRTLGAQEDERRRIARELHDETAQVLATLLIQSSLLREQVAHDRQTPPSPVALAHLDAIERLTQDVLASVRAIAHDLRPSVLDDLGLPAAIRWYAANRAGPAGLMVHVEADALRLSAEAETALYRVAQEALTNVIKHARARSATVRLTHTGPWVELTVEDNGRGFLVDDVLGSANRERRLGLLGMQERVHLLDGQLSVTAARNCGTRVVARVPAEGISTPDHESASLQSVGPTQTGSQP